VTNSLDVLEILRVNEGIDVVLCGGRFMRSENAFFGPLTLESIRQFNVPKWFLFPATVSLERGVCSNLEEYCTIHRQMEASADQAYVLAGRSKFEQKALLKMYDMNPNHIYVTDSGLPEELKKLYAGNGMTIVTG
jgi:DeoR/GlpR family transcriptional regulator of sugar metabolism